MKKYKLTFLAMGACLTQTYAMPARAGGGNDAGHGGQVRVCFVPNTRETQIASIELWDHFEAVSAWGLTLEMGDPSAPRLQQVRYVTDRLKRIDPVAAKRYQERAEAFAREMHPVKEDQLKYVDDASPELKPGENCHRVQLVQQMPTDDRPFAKRYRVNEMLWNHPLMSEQTRAGTILHETIIRDGFYSDNVRYYNAAISSTEARTMTAQDYSKLVAPFLKKEYFKVTTTDSDGRITVGTNSRLQCPTCSPDVFSVNLPNGLLVNAAPVTRGFYTEEGLTFDQDGNLKTARVFRAQSTEIGGSPVLLAGFDTIKSENQALGDTLYNHLWSEGLKTDFHATGAFRSAHIAGKNALTVGTRSLVFTGVDAYYDYRREKRVAREFVPVSFHANGSVASGLMDLSAGPVSISWEQGTFNIPKASADGTDYGNEKKAGRVWAPLQLFVEFHDNGRFKRTVSPRMSDNQHTDLPGFPGATIMVNGRSVKVEPNARGLEFDAQGKIVKHLGKPL